MHNPILRFTSSAVIIYLTVAALQSVGAATHPLARNGTHFCGVCEGWTAKRYSDQYPNRRYARSSAANLNSGEPRTVRMIYFLPNDRPYRADVVQKMKDTIRTVQTFYAEQMEAHGYGKMTFRVETDPQGELIVHRVDGRHPDSHYLDDTGILVDEVREMFDADVNTNLIVIDNSTDQIDRRWGGIGYRLTKQGGEAVVPGGFRFEITAHELGHAFGLQHDFQDGAYIMSYGSDWSGSVQPDRKQLSLCHADFLSVHSYFNPDTPFEEVDTPAIKLISPRVYSPGAKSVPIKIEVSDFDGLHQVILHAAQPDNRWSVKSCRKLGGKREAVITFDYDGVIPSAHDPSYSRNTSLLNPLIHPIVIEAVDMNGDVDSSLEAEHFRFVLFSEALQPITKISGDNQHGLPNTPLPVPFVVELRDLSEGLAREGVTVRFTVTAGGGTLSQARTETDRNGRAETTLTLGPNLGTNTVAVFTEGHTVTFNAVAGPPVGIPDANLRAAIGDALNKVPDTPIAPAEIATLPRLEAPNANISDLTGLEGATNLTHLRLHRNAISDISPVAELTNLTVLEINDNNISDTSPLANLINLRHLELPNNNVSDISAVSGLTNLTVLNLGGNAISDISAVARLTRLTRLQLSNNAISDVSPLLGLNLIGLSWDSTGLYIEDNPLSYPSINTHIPAMQTKGVEVKFDNRTPTTLLNISGVINELDNLLILEVRDSNNLAFAGVPVTFTVTSGGGTLSVTSTTTDGKGRAQSTLTLGSDGDTNIVRANVEGISESMTFSDVQANIPDSNLRAAIEEALGKKERGPIAPGEMAALARLKAPNANITDLTGLEHATNLTELHLGAEWVEAEGTWKTSNSVSNLAPLAGLTNLTRLDLRGNNIADLSHLARLTNLTWLGLWDNRISDLSPLSELTNLTELRLGGNSISNLSPLAGLTNLATLLLQSNSSSNLSPLAGLTNLTRLGLAGNGISDLSPLAGLTNLATLGLHGNGISDLSPLAGLTNLTKVVLRYNNISDLSALVTNTGLRNGGTVNVKGNPLSYQSIHTHIPALQNRGVTVEFDNRAHSALLKISGDNQNGALLVRLSQPFVVEAQDANGSPLTGISVRFAVTAGGGTLSTTITRTDTNGRAQSTLTLGPNLGTNTVSVSATGIESPATFYAIADSELPQTTADVNGDGSVNFLDLILITSNLGNTGANLAADVSGDGVVDILDIVLVTGTFDSAAAAPSAQPQVSETLTAVEIQGWLTDASSLEGKDPIMKRGIMVLEQLLISLTPTETELLANYPNPFNPETWIPYRLAEDAFVTLTIYDGSGHAVRTLDVGHQIASAYENRSKALYWDGRNNLGEQVASGVYFYTLTAGGYSATRKMVILK